MAFISFDPSDYFNTSLHTGNASTQSITGVGFQPDFTWIKARSEIKDHRVFDSSRGATKVLYPSISNGEATTATSLTSFDSDGFSLGASDGINKNTITYVSWNWKSNSGTTASNSDGSITSTVQVNTTAGFSIVTWTGTGSNATVGHGLGATPKLIMAKRRTAGENWAVYHEALGNTKYVALDDTRAGTTSSVVWNDTSPTSTTISVGTQDKINASGNTYVAYCFKEVPGFSKFGSYTGNGSSEGPFLGCGFKPGLIIIKRTDTTGSFFMCDPTRDTNSLGAANTKGSADSQHQQIFADAGDAESTYNASAGDFTSTGYKLRSTNASTNGSGGTFIYMAWADVPQVTSSGKPGTAV